MIAQPQAEYDRLPGIVSSSVGYTGGKTPSPTYDSVCDGDGHTKAIKVSFDPSVITYEELAERVLREASPSSHGDEQYKSALFVQDDAQAAIASRVAKKLGKESLVLPKSTWTDAEGYHRDKLAPEYTYPPPRPLHMRTPRHSASNRITDRRTPSRSFRLDSGRREIPREGERDGAWPKRDVRQVVLHDRSLS